MKKEYYTPPITVNDADDERFMREALALAREAARLDEVPIGAVCVREGKIISRAHNMRERSKCATHHAEILAIEEACRVLGGWRLTVPPPSLFFTSVAISSTEA